MLISLFHGAANCGRRENMSGGLCLNSSGFPIFVTGVGRLHMVKVTATYGYGEKEV